MSKICFNILWKNVNYQWSLTSLKSFWEETDFLQKATGFQYDLLKSAVERLKNI